VNNNSKNKFVEALVANLETIATSHDELKCARSYDKIQHLRNQINDNLGTIGSNDKSKSEPIKDELQDLINQINEL
jgi:seryl-tRNA synthetase